MWLVYKRFGQDRVYAHTNSLGNTSICHLHKRRDARVYDSILEAIWVAWILCGLAGRIEKVLAEEVVLK